MFVRWKRRLVPENTGSTTTSCPHRSSARWRLTPVILWSYKNGEGKPRHETIWRPRISINECCAGVISARRAFWEQMEGRLAALAGSPLAESAAGVLNDRLQWLRGELARRLPPPTDPELIDLVEKEFRAR